MTKSRLEAFSDGVFAIVITLLVLDIRLPEAEIHADADLLRALLGLAPNILTFLFSFLVVGVFWVAHHRIFAFAERVDHFLLWANIFYLMTVALIPFPAGVLARHPFFPTSVVFYAGLLVLVGIQHFLLIWHIYRHPGLQSGPVTKVFFTRSLRLASVGPVCYLLALAASPVSAGLSFAFLILALLFYIFLAQLFLPGTKQAE